VADKVEDGAWLRVRRYDERSRQKSARKAGPQTALKTMTVFLPAHFFFSIERKKTGVVLISDGWGHCLHYFLKKDCRAWVIDFTQQVYFSG
jgi:hypothetical protein